jgi:hypothetical protein
MRQRTKNHRNQRSIDKKIRFFSKFLRNISRWVRFVQKTRSKNSHAWAPLRGQTPKKYFFILFSKSRLGSFKQESNLNTCVHYIKCFFFMWLLTGSALLLLLSQYITTLFLGKFFICRVLVFLSWSLALVNKYMPAETIEVCQLRIELEPTAYRPVRYNHGATPHLSPLNVIMYFLLNLSFLKSYWTRWLINSREKPYIFITAFGQLSLTSAEAVWKILTNFLISKKWCNRIGFEYRAWAKSFLKRYNITNLYSIVSLLKETKSL